MKDIINFPEKKIISSYKYYSEYIDIKNQLLKQINHRELANIIKDINIFIVENIRTSRRFIKKMYKKKQNIFSCGNGGSASTAEHLSCDFFKQSCNGTNLNIQVFSLNSNVSLMTAIANDISYDEIFSFQLNKYGNKKDILLLFSVSGSSKNIVKCAQIAKKNV